MDEPRILTNSTRSDRLLKTKLKILQRTLRIRGVEVEIIRSTNSVNEKVHGFNNIDLDGDQSTETVVRTCRLVLNLNNLEHLSEKGNSTQTVLHNEDIAEEGDIIRYKSHMYEYNFKVERKNVYGELNLLYEFELDNFKTIKINSYKIPEVTYQSKEIDQMYAGEGVTVPAPDPTDWRNRIDDLENI